MVVGGDSGRELKRGDGITPNSGLTGPGVAPSPTPWCSKLSKREPSGHPRLWSPTHLYIWGAYDKFPDFFRIGIQNCRRHLKIHFVIATYIIRWLTNFYDSASKEQLQQQLE